MLSQWLTEDIDEKNLFSHIYANSKPQRNVIENKMKRAGAVYGDYTEYSRYSAYYGDYTEYSRYSAYYGDYTEYSRYSAYYEDYTEYIKYEAYGNYADYDDYSNACVLSCQVCNTCQTKCQVNQYAYTYVGHKMAFSNTLDYIDEQDYNDLIDYINAAATVCLLNINLTSSKPSETSKVEVSIFNTINTAIKSFIDGATGYNNKNAATDKVLKSELEKFRDILNQVKIPTTIPCCQTAGYQNCISREL